MSSNNQDKYEKMWKQGDKIALRNIRRKLDNACMNSSKKSPMKKWDADVIIEDTKYHLNFYRYKTLKKNIPNYVRTCNKANTLADLTRSMIHVYIEEEIKKMDNRY